MTLEIGKKAPNFKLAATNGEIVKLSDFKGKNVILYFYPKDLTTACINQACDFRDKITEFTDNNTVILGVSMDPVKQHHRFIDKYNLPFMLLADEDHAVCELYEVWLLKKLYGVEYMGIVRSTFLIDKKGILVKEWRNIRVKGHVEAVLGTVRGK
ncbi:thioredoxin-dependent thiol peroxidase [Paenibacillus psychroresistens]|uniref:thioredoxin-dependent peroxiredoxin n=1 Tax=Paenibacillus psychroresistens TaxID=1778678 RepID=A0A6B8RRF1_9BACL|nr:thioredoxin-dependent thiol peroxidase [Paenibacillus psychroresistens]QGQ98549.1 thioredoxin-dependent thiol peroxidase [Paenibacillus psychroresistens]